MTRILTLLFVLLLVAGPVHAENFNTAQKQEIEQIIKQYLLDNPEILYQAAENHQRNEERKADEQALKVLKDAQASLFKNADLPFIGNPKAKITLVEFFDYNCGYCKQALPGLMKFLDEDKDVKIILIETPILSRESFDAAKMALAANTFGKYSEYHQALMNFQGPKTAENLDKMATDLGLDATKMRNVADSDAVRNQIAGNMDLFRNLGLNGTPAFAAPDRVIRGFVGPEVLRQIVKELRDGSKKE